MASCCGLCIQFSPFDRVMIDSTSKIAVLEKKEAVTIARMSSDLSSALSQQDDDPTF